MKNLFYLVIAVLFNTVVLAQDNGGGKDINVNVNTKNGAWYSSPWVWVIGAAIFILLLVAISRGGGRRSD
jgi:hypothetical protein